MSSFIDSLELNPNQKDAALHTEGPLLVLAGAGTGKTRVLTSRIAYIINSGKAQSSEILAVTFTNKAAKEMHERINHLLGNHSNVSCGTFHSISARILRKNAGLIGLTPYFSIIDQDDQEKIIKSILLDMGIDKKESTPRSIAYIISRWKDMGLKHSQISTPDLKSQEHITARKIYEIYQNKLLGSNLCDFGDLLLHSINIFFEHKNVLESLQNQYKYILVDEYQDTNPAQYLWVRMLADKSKNICCVGDDDQSIYSWRGAEIANILRFEKDFLGARVIALEQNYRSTAHILNAASSLIKNNGVRHKKTLWSDKNEGEKIRVISCYNEREEAKYIASTIISLSQKINFSNIAVLVRAGFQTRAFEEAFISSNIQYKIIGGIKFYERAEIKDSMAYLRLITNTRDDVAFERIINTPKRSVGPSTLLSIKNFAHEKSVSYIDAARLMLETHEFKGKLEEKISFFVSIIDKYKNKIQYPHSASDTFKDMISELGYIDMLKLEKTEESRARLDNINELISAMEDFDSITDFVQHVSLVMDNDSSSSGINSVNLMTVHASKGLEYEAVFIPGMEEGLFPHQKSLNDQASTGIEEERRIAYVGITRAKKLLYLLYAESRRIFHEFVNSIPSRFISEIDQNSIIRGTSTGYIAYDRVLDNKSIYKHTATEHLDPIRPGSRVSHQTFGYGVIIKKNSDNLEIAFDKSGIKTIKEAFVSLVT